jgi:3-methyladenine DNA glycosylase/8-oxoguanine DNA glycosylase
MKVTVEVDCTPIEARSFLGLPDVTPLNDHLVSEMQKRFDSNVAMMQPEELMKSWMSFGGVAQEQFFKLMSAAAGAGMAGGGQTKP